MKSYLLFILFATLILFPSCEGEEMMPEEEERLINLTGEWLGEGYICPPDYDIDERIRIEHNLETGEVIATKITGDNCVMAGNITFQGMYDGIESTFQVTFITGQPNNPNSSSINSSIEVINSKLIRDVAFEGIVFTKDFDSELPDCPCSYFDSRIQNEEEENGGVWDNCGPASQIFHYGAEYEVRWHPEKEGDPGQQCTYSIDGSLITNGIAAGSPDKIGPGTCGWGPINEFFANNACWSSHCEYDVMPWKEIPCFEYLSKWKANDGSCSSFNEVSGISHMERMIGEMTCYEATTIIQRANESIVPIQIDDELRRYIIGEGVALSETQLIEKLENWKDLNLCFLFPNEEICLVIDKAILNLQ